MGRFRLSLILSRGCGHRAFGGKGIEETLELGNHPFPDSGLLDGFFQAAKQGGRRRPNRFRAGVEGSAVRRNGLIPEKGGPLGKGAGSPAVGSVGNAEDDGGLQVHGQGDAEFLDAGGNTHSCFLVAGLIGYGSTERKPG